MNEEGPNQANPIFANLLESEPGIFFPLFSD